MSGQVTDVLAPCAGHGHLRPGLSAHRGVRQLAVAEPAGHKDEEAQVEEHQAHHGQEEVVQVPLEVEGRR